MRHLRFAYFLYLFCLAMPAGLFAQGAQATLTGRVTDPSGAAVPSVKIQVKNIGTNAVTPIETDSTGGYTAPYLQPGNYSVSAESTGFKKFVRDGLVLSVGGTVTADITLEVGALSDQITVTGETPLLETASADRGTLIDQTSVVELPLNGRNPFMLSQLVAGVNYNGQVMYERPFDNGAIAYWTINGGLFESNEFLLDGAPNNAQGGTNNIAYVPPVDAVQEFKIQTNSYDAQYGHTSGGIINVSLKSGTNSPHGTVYEFARRPSWDANSFQNNAQGVPRSEHTLDQYGGQLAGPVYIPKVYDGRNKTFFLFTFERYHEVTPRPQTLSVPAPEFLQGDFSKLNDGNGHAVTIYDPTTGTQNASGAWIRQPFAGNLIPADRINPIAKNILSYFPAPNTTTPDQPYSQLNDFFQSPDEDHFYNQVAKIDQQIGQRNHIFFREVHSNRYEMGYDGGTSVIGPGDNGSLPEIRINTGLDLDWVGVISPRMVLNARVSFSRYVGEDRGDANQGFDITKLGFPGSLASQLPGGPYFGQYNINNYQTLGEYPSGDITNTGAVAASLNYDKGGHSLKAGIDARNIQYISQNYGAALSFTADPTWTQQNYAQADALSGNSIASFLLGTPQSGSSGYNSLGVFMYKYYAPWVQDNWRITRKLTVNLGLRWDFNIPANERFNRLDRGFDPNVANPVNQMIDQTQFPGYKVQGGLLFAGVNGQPRNAADTYMRAVQPRFGFAYQINSKLVMRGGWGRYFLNPSNSYLQTAGFNTSTPMITASNATGSLPIANVINSPFPTGINLPAGASLGALTFLGHSLNSSGSYVVNPKFILPHMDQFSFGFQYELPRRSKVEISYVGSRADQLESNQPINFIPLSLRQQCNQMEGGNPLYCDQSLPNPFYQKAPFLGTSYYTNQSMTRSALTVPYPQFGTITEQDMNANKSWYNAMQVTYEIRATGGLTLIANYTLSKQVYQNGYNDIQKLVPERSIYQYDSTHGINVSSVWAIPAGPNKRWLSGTHGFLGRLLGGWETNMMFRYHTGIPWNLPANFVYVKEAKLSNLDWNQPVVHLVQPCTAVWNDNGSITMQKYSVTAGCGSNYNFLIQPRFAPTSEPNYDPRLRLHTVPTADAALNKSTRISERASLQFRAECFNLTNTYSIYRQQPNRTLTSSSFGTITPSTVSFSNSNVARDFQLSLKLTF